MLFLLFNFAASQCIPLAGSSACPAYSTRFFNPSAPIALDIKSISNVEQFDAAIRLRTSSESGLAALQEFWQCPEWDSIALNPRYRTTFLCAFMTETNECPKPIGKMCKSNCFAYVEGLKRILKNVCKSSEGDRAKAIRQLDEICTMSPFNGVEGDCISGEENEADTCGFTDAQTACDYCASKTQDKCCSKLKTSCLQDPTVKAQDSVPDSNNNATIAIISGSVAFAFIVFIVGFAFVQRRRTTTIPKIIGDNITETKSTNSISPRKQSELADVEKRENTNSTFIVVHDYHAQRNDEISLKHGQTLQVNDIYDDGWGSGVNVDTLENGVFPMVCLLEEHSQIN